MSFLQWGLNDVHMDIDREEDNVKIVLEGDNMGVAIGRRGKPWMHFNIW